MSKEAMKLALRALRFANDDGYKNEVSQEAITALKEALAKQEQGEPVAEVKRNSSGQIYIEWRDGEFAIANLIDAKLYTTPQQRKPLTDEMIVAGGKALAKLHADSCGLDFDDVWKYYAEDHKADAKAAIEAAHGIKE